MLAHPFDRFYVVTKFMLPTIGDLKFSKLNFDYTSLIKLLSLSVYILNKTGTAVNKVKSF